MKVCPLEENYASLLIVDYDKTLFFLWLYVAKAEETQKNSLIIQMNATPTAAVNMPVCLSAVSVNRVIRSTILRICLGNAA